MPRTKVYAVEAYYLGEGSMLKGVFSTKKKAEEYLQKYTEGSSEEWKKKYRIKTYKIDEQENIQNREYWRAQCRIKEGYIDISEKLCSNNTFTIFKDDYEILYNESDYILVDSYISSKHARGIIIKLLEERENK